MAEILIPWHLPPQSYRFSIFEYYSCKILSVKNNLYNQLFSYKYWFCQPISGALTNGLGLVILKIVKNLFFFKLWGICHGFWFKQTPRSRSNHGRDAEMCWTIMTSNPKGTLPCGNGVTRRLTILMVEILNSFFMNKELKCPQLYVKLAASA